MDVFVAKSVILGPQATLFVVKLRRQPPVFDVRHVGDARDRRRHARVRGGAFERHEVFQRESRMLRRETLLLRIVVRHADGVARLRACQQRRGCGGEDDLIVLQTLDAGGH